MKLRTVAIVILALAAAVSCQSRRRPVSIPLVREILQDKSGREYQLISASSELNPQGEIVIIGSERAVTILSETMATIDVRDNVDGSFGSDGLPDFAGETIACIIDTTGRPEELMFVDEASLEMAEFRRFFLNGFINALDTLYHETPFDLEGIGRKIPAKMIVPADPILTDLIKYDVDTLFSALGSKVHIVAPVDELSASILNSRPGHDVMAAVMHDPMFDNSDIYVHRFKDNASAAGLFGSSVCSLPTPGNAENLFTAFLDEYAGAGYSRPINVIAVADIGVDFEAFKSDYASSMSILSEDSAKYSKYLAKDFSFISSLEIIVARCYDTLRADNIFTHNIADPQIVTYYCYPDPQDRFVSFLVPASYVQN